MGVSSVQSQGNGVVPGYQQGGTTSQADLDKMSSPDLVKLLSSGSEVDKQNAFAELQERLKASGAEGGEKGPENGEPEKGGGGGEKGVSGGEEGGSGSHIDELLELLDKVRQGKPLTPEEKQKLQEAGIPVPEQGNTPPDQGGDPNTIPSNAAPPGNV